ncbi:hypothetical protein GGR57DRAFT_460373 [Xylariaceae sp. FL1272]|nr:hypothetical protein GGR57DRAFT_460373 [Xylariaceae sp. FL1272]
MTRERDWRWAREPTTPLQQSIAARIEITNAQLFYRHGDLVTGIVKKTHIEQAPEAVTAVIKLICRVRSKVEDESTNSDGTKSTTHHWGENTLFETSQTVFKGSARYGANVWPFSFAIPTATPSLFHQLPPATIRCLPPSHYSSGEKILFAKRCFVFVEYVLEAKIFGTSLKPPPALATFPIYVQQRSHQEHITDTEMRAVNIYQTARTLHLDPEIAEKRLSLRQHMQTVFHPSSIPSYSYSIIVEYPSLLQLDHPTPLEFRIRAVPDLAPQKPTGVPVKKPPALTLVAAKLLLGSKRVVDALEGNSRFVRNRTESSYWQEIALIDWKEGPGADKPLLIPDGTRQEDKTEGFEGKKTQTDDSHGADHTGDRTEDSGTILDMGARQQLRLTSRGLLMGRHLRSLDVPIQPSFASRHIEQFHQLRWKLVVKCAGETTKVAGSAPVRVLGPSENFEHARAIALDENDVHLAYRAWHAREAPTPALAQNVTQLAKAPPPQHPVHQDDREYFPKPLQS